MDLLSALIKPQPQYPALSDPATLLALANLKYPIGNFNLPSYAHSLIPPRSNASGGIPNFDLASIIAAAATAQNGDSKSSLPSLVTSLASSDHTSTAMTTPTPSSASSVSFSQLPIPIPAQPTSPTQSSASASSISSGGSLIPSAQSSPARPTDTNTPLFGAGFKRKLDGTPSRKPPKPIPDENKDSAYYERRKKNNDAAKRSRDARKMKEEQTAARASFLEQENIQLRTQIELMKAEIAKLQVMLITKSATTDFSMPSTASDFSMINVKEETTDKSEST